jgi:tetratricopeptide (TPR) repeat protein
MGWSRTGLLLAGLAAAAISAHPQNTPQLPVVQQTAALAPARLAFQAKEYGHARALFSAYLEKHPGNIEAEMGVANCDLASHAYETAELAYRKVTDQQPEFWPAHKNLVIVEAALGRWGEFDREREVLRLARERGAPGISARESDVIDAFDAPDGRWIVRQYFEPVGRSLTRYNFERFSADGRVEEYISLESTSAAQSALSRGDVIIGRDLKTPSIHDWALNWYTGKSHGTILRYPKGEPSYETVRAAVRRWLRIQHAAGR